MSGHPTRRIEVFLSVSYAIKYSQTTHFSTTRFETNFHFATFFLRIRQWLMCMCKNDWLRKKFHFATTFFDSENLRNESFESNGWTVCEVWFKPFSQCNFHDYLVSLVYIWNTPLTRFNVRYKFLESSSSMAALDVWNRFINSRNRGSFFKVCTALN